MNQRKQEYALAKSEWSFKTAIELSAALAAKKVSAVELAQDAISRIERQHARIMPPPDNCVAISTSASMRPAPPTPPARAARRALLGIP